MADVETLIDRIDALVSRYYHHADEETRAVITNLTGIHRLMADLIVAQALEREHWAAEARDAVEARDEERDKRLDAESVAEGLADELRQAERYLAANDADIARLNAHIEGLESQLRGGAA